MKPLCRIRVALFALLAVLALAAPADAQTFPSLSGRVVDDAGILDQAMRASLTAKLAALEAKTTDQLVIVTVKSLQGLAVEDYANRLFRAWGLGQKDRNNGVLLVVAPNDRKVRIEVGYGLEGTLPDAIAKLIIDQSILPRFRAADMAGGVVRGTDDIILALTGEGEALKRRAPPAASGSQVHDRGTVELSPVVGFLVLGLFGLVAAFMAFVAGFAVMALIVHFLVFIHVLPQKKDRHGFWLWVNYFDYAASGGRRQYGSSGWSSGSSGSSSSSDSFSGGGGSSGGGGASGSW
ncbi:MAG TPA: TPM domain-containing protein [Xanthobacteraceae bacterium]